MTNLKITIALSSPLLADRLLTIDSILLGLYYNLKAQKAGEKQKFVDSVDHIGFIDKKEGVLSGSIWYIDPNAPVSFDFTRYTKKPETRKFVEHGITKTLHDEGKGEYKAGLFEDEIMAVESIYFYVRGDKAIVSNLLGYLKFVGKKGSIGYGRVESVRVAEIDEDKGHLLNPTTPSKPLPVESFDVRSKKISFYRSRPPYWSIKDLELCYMPTTALVETADNSYSKTQFDALMDMSYVPNVSFVRKCVENLKIQGFTPFVLTDYKVDTRKKRWELYDGEPQVCAFSGIEHTQGIKGNIREYMAAGMENFTDQGFMHGNDFIGDDFLWSVKKAQLDNLGDTLVTSNSIEYVQGKKKVDGRRFPDFIMEPTKLKPPFSLNVKTTSNAQHVVFKGRVAISNAFFPMQLGSNTMYVDGELLEEAIADAKRIVAEVKAHGISRTHLTGNWSGGLHPQLKNALKSEESLKVINDFQKKYDRTIRKLVFYVSEIK
jgi:hypothetical protein